MAESECSSSILTPAKSDESALGVAVVDALGDCYGASPGLETVELGYLSL